MNAIPFIAGMVFGCVCGVLLCMALFYVALHYREHPEDWNDYDDEPIDLEY